MNMKKVILFIGLTFLIFLVTSGNNDNHKNEHQHILETMYGFSPTCTNSGLSNGTKCSICNTILEQQVEIPALGHNLGDWEIIEATYTQNGKKKRKCTRCDYFEEEDIPMLDAEAYVNDIIKSVVIPSEIMSDITLPYAIGGVDIKWKTTNNYLLTSEGKIVERYTTNKKVSLIATYYFHTFSKEVTYNIVILGYTDEEKLQMEMDKISFPEIVSGNMDLQTNFSYGIIATYISSDPDCITNEGIVTLQDEEVIVSMTVILKLGENEMEKTFDLKLAKYEPDIKNHQIIEYAKDFDVNTQENLNIMNDRLVLANDAITATYYSKEINTLGFTSLVGSWSAISSVDATCELKISLKVDDVWSDYITYSPWGLGLQNASHDQNNGIIKLSTDEVMVLNNKKATGMKYSVTLNRTSLNVDSPKLSLVSFALSIPEYSYYVNIKDLPKEVVYDVPKLYQGAVPVIGNSICSATSTTMLLKYHGFHFSSFDAEYEHRYIASIVRDYGNNIYGNWVYNTVTMGGYGLNSYVARMYSVDELIYHLAHVGPVALSVKGTMISNEKTYTTAGHLIVAIGYKYVNDVLYIVCNDPNVENVYCEYSLSVINNTWRNITYVVEK